MIYFDTAYILKCYISENGSEAVRSLASQHDQIACCEYGRMELHAAIHRCLRDSIIDTRYFEIIVEQVERDESDNIWNWLPLTHEVIGGVIQAFRNLPSGVNLRTGDAIHLQCAAANEINNLYTNDRHMNRAAGHFGLTANNVIETPN